MMMISSCINQFQLHHPFALLFLSPLQVLGCLSILVPKNLSSEKKNYLSTEKKNWGQFTGDGVWKEMTDTLKQQQSVSLTER